MQDMRIEDFLAKHAEPTFRLKQYNQALYQTLISDFSQLTSWPAALRAELINHIKISSLREAQSQVSRNQDTLKVLFERLSHPGQFFETVLMMHRDGRNTVCVSCMVGCPVGCQFCATGNMGLVGKLTTQEIVDQVLGMARFCKARHKKITNIVFMGMGEPLLNLDAVLAAIDVFTDPGKMAISESRIVISTAGIIEPLKQLLAKDFKGRLALSLHAPTQELRERIMPIAKNNPLDQLLLVIDDYVEKTNKRVSFEYLLLKNINDKEHHAQKLAKLMRDRLAHINLIPYNPVPGKSFQSPHRNQMERFAYQLKRLHVPYTIRVSMGDDIDAACGQLATKGLV